MSEALGFNLVKVELPLAWHAHARWLLHLAGKARIVETEFRKVRDEHSFLRVLCAPVFSNLRFGLPINFHEERLADGVNRIVNGYGSQALKS